MISKELLGDVLEVECTAVDKILGDVVGFSIDGIDVGRINAFELASKTKEYFLNYGNGYCIMSFIDFDGTWFANVSGSVFKKGFQGTSEYEVIFKASNWIIETEDNLDGSN